MTAYVTRSNSGVCSLLNCCMRGFDGSLLPYNVPHHPRAPLLRASAWMRQLYGFDLLQRLPFAVLPHD